MAMNFGKSNRSIAFNPTSAFPLDARGYFESYEAAVAAALLAKEVGSTETVYYYGQTLVVVENDKATLYIIQPDNTLKPIEGNEIDNEFSLVVDDKVFVVDTETGALGLKGFEGAAAGSVATVGADGSISWTVPVDAYSKIETEGRIAAVVAESAHLKRKIVADIEEAKQYIANNDDADQYIYMVPTGLQEDDDKYDEYIVLEITDEDGITTKILEKVGSWEVNLSDYAKTKYVNDELAKKVDIIEGSSLVTTEEITRLNSIKDLIQSVDTTNFTVNNSGHLNLNDLPISKITNLETVLNNKIDTKQGYTLLGPTDQEKLKALIINDEGRLEISGIINVNNVQGLNEWISENSNKVIGLSENNFTSDLLAKLNGIEAGAQKNYISSVTTDFEVSVNGELRLVSITSAQVSDLATLLNEKASVNSLTALQLDVEDLETDVAALKQALTWQNLPNI